MFISEEGRYCIASADQRVANTLDSVSAEENKLENKLEQSSKKIADTF